MPWNTAASVTCDREKSRGRGRLPVYPKATSQTCRVSWAAARARDLLGDDACLQEAMPRRHGHRLGAALDAQLVEDGGEMVSDGAGGDEELPADRFAREPLGYEAGIRSTCVQQGQVSNP